MFTPLLTVNASLSGRKIVEGVMKSWHPPYSICHAQKGSREDTGHNDAMGAPKSSFPGAAAMRKLVLVLIGLRSSFADCRATSRQRAAIICAWMSICVIWSWHLRCNPWHLLRETQLTILLARSNTSRGLFPRIYLLKFCD